MAQRTKICKGKRFYISRVWTNYSNKRSMWEVREARVKGGGVLKFDMCVKWWFKAGVGVGTHCGEGQKKKQFLDSSLKYAPFSSFAPPRWKQPHSKGNGSNQSPSVIRNTKKLRHECSLSFREVLSRPGSLLVCFVNGASQLFATLDFNDYVSGRVFYTVARWRRSFPVKRSPERKAS